MQGNNYYPPRRGFNGMRGGAFGFRRPMNGLGMNRGPFGFRRPMNGFGMRRGFNGMRPMRGGFGMRGGFNGMRGRGMIQRRGPGFRGRFLGRPRGFGRGMGLGRGYGRGFQGIRRGPTLNRGFGRGMGLGRGYGRGTFNFRGRRGDSAFRGRGDSLRGRGNNKVFVRGRGGQNQGNKPIIEENKNNNAS
ncbi:MAG: hypothetical protein MJ252_10840 [archaeon]|nr:hypothetical protein [archaeon]